MSFDRLRTGVKWGPAVFALVAWGCLDPLVSREASPDLALKELVPGISYAEWFELHTGIVPDTAGLGVYSVARAVSDVPTCRQTSSGGETARLQTPTCIHRRIANLDSGAPGCGEVRGQ